MHPYRNNYTTSLNDYLAFNKVICSSPCPFSLPRVRALYYATSCPISNVVCYGTTDPFILLQVDCTSACTSLNSYFKEWLPQLQVIYNNPVFPSLCVRRGLLCERNIDFLDRNLSSVGSYSELVATLVPYCFTSLRVHFGMFGFFKTPLPATKSLR